uniref:Rx N-terminal domain-containing protein n=1 Tax=Triticum aestivum TaxID=4565 RepID=A0A3B6RPE4_WHEAT
MAEFALGLTKTAVEGTVSRVKSAIDEEAKLRIRVQNDLVFITGEFEMMQSFLNAANKERANTQVVRTWVRHVRDLALDVEDCLEFVVHLDNKSTWSWLWRVLPDCMAPVRPLDVAVADIQRLKARVEDVSQRNTRYNLIGDSGSHSNSKPTVVTTVSSLTTELMPDSGPAAAFRILHKVWEATDKIRPDMGDLRKLITNEGSDLEVISVCGSPGASDLGVTHVLREAYNDPKICQEFTSRAWVKLTHPFNLNEFIKILLTQFYASSNRASVGVAGFRKNMKEAVAKEDELMQQVSQLRYLVIVEQLSSVVEWDAIRMYLPESKNGSRIVVTTKQLGLAFSCTGNPYQVSNLRQLSGGQSLCAFFNKVSEHRSDMGELIWQLRHVVGVISVQKHPDLRSSTLIDKAYTGVTNKSKEFEEVKFERHSWVDVPYSFSLGVFARHLFLNFHSNDLRAKKIIAAGTMGDTGVIQGCHKFLREDRCLVVINGLDSTDSWDQIKAAFLSEPTKSCILVITKEASVARYCVGETDRPALNTKDLEADVVLRRSMKGCEYNGLGAKEASSRGRFFCNRREEAHVWTSKFKLIVDPHNVYYPRLRHCLQQHGTISLCGDEAWRSALARKIYYNQMLIAHEDGIPPTVRVKDGKKLDSGFTKFSWVDVPHPFDLMDFSWRLSLDFHSDDLKAKQNAIFGLMEGRHDPIEECLNFLRHDKCLVVIDGLQSENDWNLIRDVLFSEPTNGCIIVSTGEESVATHCVHHENRVFLDNGRAADLAAHVQSRKKQKACVGGGSLIPDRRGGDGSPTAKCRRTHWSSAGIVVCSRWSPKIP